MQQLKYNVIRKTQRRGWSIYGKKGFIQILNIKEKISQSYDRFPG